LQEVYWSKLANMSDVHSTGVQPIAKLSGLKRNRPKYVKVEGAHLVVALVEGRNGATDEVVAFSALCPHQMGDLSGGSLDEEGIDCPLHFYRFDVRTGACLYPRGEDLKLKTYAVQVEGDDIFVQIEKPKWMTN
jgi:nitrite reductase/ring-hydroxylating ferredoxin subunit